MKTNLPLVEHQIFIRAYDIDAMGIVSNIVYVRWFEDLRHIMMDDYCPYADMIKENKSPMLIKTEVEYLKPLTIQDKPVGKLWLTKAGNVKWELVIEITTGDAVHCRGKQTGCFFDLNTSKVTTIPDYFLKIFEITN